MRQGFILNNFELPPHAEAYMRQSVALAEQAKGQTAPNPCVGAVLTRDGRIVAQGYHHAPGLPHAEVEALLDAQNKGLDPGDCILWVTLEPCNHTGRTGPCTHAIVRAGIKHVVVGCVDPNPRVQGGGIEYLRAAGVHVDVGVAQTACQDLIADFVTWSTTALPYLYLKLAATLDGRIAARSGDSRWISNPQSRQMVHALRARVGAVLIGSGTLYADNPRLTARLADGPPDSQVPPAADRPADTSPATHSDHPGQPLAVIIGSSLPSPDADLFLLRQRPTETIFCTPRPIARGVRADQLRSLGCRVWGLGEDNRVDPREVLLRLRSDLGVMDVLCEGGGGLAQQLAVMELVGEWWLFLAPKTLGDRRAVPVLHGSASEDMNAAQQWRYTRVHALGDDLRLVLRPKASTIAGDECLPD
jgi:diaminohydroxyphosphoribosylaminopyrimidine deaminase / 5-amino-6-(5-phosphoribosylamino)uracil reductase